MAQGSPGWARGARGLSVTLFVYRRSTKVSHHRPLIEEAPMRSLGVQLPDRELRPSSGGPWRDIFFGIVSFLATFLGALLIIGLLL
jgi:hypothetical protein